MVDPSKITNYHLKPSELEEHLLWWVLAAGKNGTTMSRLLENFLQEFRLILSYQYPPFFLLYHFSEHDIAIRLKKHGIGCYTHKAKTIYQLVHSGLALETCTAEELENIYGIGMKTSRCFILHSRKGAQYAGLDTHILKFLKKEGHDVPKSTPPRKKYLELEQIFLKIAEREKKLPADLDLEVWNAYSIK